MSNRHVNDTNCGPILDAVSKGKTIIVVFFLHLDPQFYNIHVVLPTLEEASALYNILSYQPNWKWDLETAFLHKYIPVKEERDWLMAEAPAGFASSVCESMLNCAMPVNPDEIQILINSMRASNSLYDQIKSLVVQAGGSHTDVNDQDVFRLLKLALRSEDYLVQQGVLENGLTIIAKKAPPTKKALVTSGIVDTEQANAELKKQGLI